MHLHRGQHIISGSISFSCETLAYLQIDLCDICSSYPPWFSAFILPARQYLWIRAVNGIQASYLQPHMLWRRWTDEQSVHPILCVLISLVCSAVALSSPLILADIYVRARKHIRHQNRAAAWAWRRAAARARRCARALRSCRRGRGGAARARAAHAAALFIYARIVQRSTMRCAAFAAWRRRIARGMAYAAARRCAMRATLRVRAFLARKSNGGARA